MKCVNSSPPVGYRISSRYKTTTGKMRAILYLGSILLWALFGWISLYLASAVRPEFNSYELINRFLESSYVSQLKVGVLCILALILLGCVHEGIHGTFLWIFSHRRPSFGCKGFNPYAALAPGAFCNRSQAILCTLAPLFIITILGGIASPYVPTEVIPILLFAVFSNAAISISDLVQSFWLLSRKRDILFGFDGVSSVVYEPADATKLYDA